MKYHLHRTYSDDSGATGETQALLWKSFYFTRPRGLAALLFFILFLFHGFFFFFFF